MNVKIAGVVVLYNPKLEFLNNIYTYINNIDILYVVDNSESLNKDIFSRIESNKKIKYIPFGENKGIAYALNYAANIAYSDGYHWLLTMDQDSAFAENMFAILLLSLKNLDTTHIGIISPVHKSKQSLDCVYVNKMEVIDAVMTSGNLVNLLAWWKIGGFDEKLFIDEVDHDFCLRLNNYGFEVIINHSSILEHNLGNYTRKFLLFGLIRSSTTNHNHIRRYYITRNKFYMMNKYKLYKVYLQELKNDFMSILFKEEDKLRKLKSFFLGIIDYIKGNMGRKNF